MIPQPTDEVILLVYPYGKWEVWATEKETLYLCDESGIIICNYSQVKKV